MRSRSALFAALSLACLLGCSSPEDQLEVARSTVPEALARGDRSAALHALRGLRDRVPGSPEALLELARLLVQVGEAPQALWLLEAGTERFPERHDVRLAQARVALLLGSPSLARSAAASIPPEAEHHFEALLVLAQAELGLGDLGRGLEVLAEAEQRYPDRPESRLMRIATLMREHRHDEARDAIAAARATLGDTPADTAVRRRLDLTLAQLQAGHEEKEPAIASLRALVEAEPGDVLAWRPLVQLLLQTGRGEEALGLLEQVLDSDPELVPLRPLQATVLAALGREEQAEAVLSALAESSDSPAAVLPLAQYHLARGQAEPAEAVLREAAERFPEEASLHLFRADALLALERPDEAREALAAFERTTFRGDPQIEYLRARLELVDGETLAATRRLEQLAPQLDTAATQFWLGRALETQGDLDGARRRYALAQRRDATWLAPSRAMLTLAQRRGDWRAVAGQARRLVARAPGELEGWLALGDALVQLGQGAAAEGVAQQAVQLFPERSEARVLQARALRAQGRIDEALAELEATREELGADPALEAEAVITLGMAGRLDEGIARGRRAVEAYADAASAHAVLASLLFAAGAAEEAAHSVDRALALEPDQLHPLRVRCEYRTASGALPGARVDCSRYLEAHPDAADVHFMLGVVHAGLGESAEAATAYRRAAELDERDFRARNNLASLLAEQGDLDGALVAAQEAYRLAEDDPTVKDTLGALYLRKGLVDRSISLLEEARAGAPDLPDAQLHLALAYLEAGRTEEARTLLVALAESGAGTPAVQERTREALDSLP